MEVERLESSEAGKERPGARGRPKREDGSDFLLECRGVEFSYPGAGRKVLQGVDIAVRERESLAITGKSGCGKTTLLCVMGLLLEPDAGEVRLDGEAVSSLAEEEKDRLRSSAIGFVFQNHFIEPHLTVLENVLLPVAVARFWHGEGEWEESRARAEALLEEVGLADKRHSSGAELSGGERQRVALARALANRPRIILADEPTGNLDSANAEKVMELLLGLVEDRGSALVLVTHDPATAARCGRIVRMKDGMLEPGPHP